MANELVKEIDIALEKCEKCADRISSRYRLWGIANELDMVRETLQRAREALRWIPVSERLPEKDGVYECEDKYAASL